MQQRTASIELLPQSVVEKIAAGEVVERPSSVVKELIENSVDAGATRIDIAIENAGFSLIRVSDNGSGMPHADLLKSLLPHATSKIRTADDLFAIATMGFRGEALASIAAVSRLSVVSSPDQSGLGNLLSSEGGVQGDVRPERHGRGTTITVRDLFYNVPARKKFMKGHRGEQLSIVRTIEQLVVPLASVHFTLSIDNKPVLDLPATPTPLERIAGLAGHEFAGQLVECRGAREGIDALLYVSTPERLGERPRFQSLYVNLRRIDNDSVTYAVREAFSQFLGGKYRPAFFCFLDLDPSRIDVNVHPTKQQVKFDDERGVFGFVFSTVKEGIQRQMVSRAAVGAPPSEPGNPAGYHPIPFPQPLPPGGVAERGGFDPLLPVFPAGDSGQTAARDPFQTVLQFPSAARAAEKDVDHIKDNTLQLAGDCREQNWDLISCYQIHGVFILAPIKNGILLIDQHAAHERVLYEQALEDIGRGRAASQQLLFPIVIELSPTEKTIVESGRAFFGSFGFEVDDFGGTSLSVSAIPAFMRDSSVEGTIREMVRYLLDGRSAQTFLEPEKRFAAAFACGAAIKAGQKLTQEEMNALLNSLFSAGNPYTCPHGRPTLVRISIDELARRFLR